MKWEIITLYNQYVAMSVTNDYRQARRHGGRWHCTPHFHNAVGVLSSSMYIWLTCELTIPPPPKKKKKKKRKKERRRTGKSWGGGGVRVPPSPWRRAWNRRHYTRTWERTNKVILASSLWALRYWMIGMEALRIHLYDVITDFQGETGHLWHSRAQTILRHLIFWLESWSWL